VARSHERATPRRCTPSVVSTGVVSGFVTALFTTALFAAAVAAAVPAAAVDDPAHPDAHVTHGPSCRPGGLVVEVQAGTVPYFVRLSTTRQPGGEAEAELAAGQSAVLRTGNVAWGETIDGRLEYTARDGSGDTYVDELENYSFTRPTKEDCDAITAPASPEPSNPGPSSSAAASSPTAGSEGAGATLTPTTSSRTDGRTPTPSAAGGPPVPSAPSTGSATSSASAQQVPAGSTVTLRGAGFLPGERVTILLHAGAAVLSSAVAGDDGTLEAEVQIPRGTSIGAARLDLVGDSSAVVTNLELQVAAEEIPAAPRGTVPLGLLVAAAIALVGSVGGLVSVAGRQRAMRHGGFSSVST
jgi:hypothetical protein